jgi:hypothetical protein
LKGLETIEEGTFDERDLILMLKQLKPSPNGKKLRERKIKNVLFKLREDEVREIIKEIAKTWAHHPLPSELFKRLHSVKKNPEVFLKIIQDDSIFSQKHALYCENHGASIFLDSEKKALELKHASSCPHCGNELHHTPVYGLTRDAEMGSQGLWLEELVGTTVRERTPHVWCGKMTDSNELDVISVLYEKIFLFECKDSSFGQNDFYILMAKAEQIRADVVVIVTTHEVHPNVRQLVTKQQLYPPRFFPGARKIYLVEGEKTQILQKKIEEVLNEETETFLRSVMRMAVEHYPVRRKVKTLPLSRF